MAPIGKQDIIEQHFDATVDDSVKFLLDSRLHDFGCVAFLALRPCPRICAALLLASPAIAECHASLSLGLVSRDSLPLPLATGAHQHVIYSMRGTTCVEQGIIGGVAHLLNFGGALVPPVPACLLA